MKEYDEAMERAVAIIYPYIPEVGDECERRARKIARLILSLKGDGWRIALVSDRHRDIREEGLPYKQVIWQGDE